MDSRGLVIGTFKTAMRSSQIVNVTVANQMFISLLFGDRLWGKKSKKQKHWEKKEGWQKRKGHEKIWSEAEVTTTVKIESTLKFCGLFKIPTVPFSEDVSNCWILWLTTPWENDLQSKGEKSFLLSTMRADLLKGQKGAREGHKVRDCWQRNQIFCRRSALILQHF